MSNYLKGLGLGLLLGYAGVTTLGCLMFGHAYVVIKDEMNNTNSYRRYARSNHMGMDDIRRAPYSYNKYYRTYTKEEKKND